MVKLSHPWCNQKMFPHDPTFDFDEIKESSFHGNFFYKNDLPSVHKKPDDVISIQSYIIILNKNKYNIVNINKIYFYFIENK